MGLFLTFKYSLYIDAVCLLLFLSFLFFFRCVIYIDIGYLPIYCFQPGLKVSVYPGVNKYIIMVYM